MKIKDLKAALNELPKDMDNLEVILSSDEEGNSFNTLSDVSDACVYIEGEVFNIDEDPDEVPFEQDEWEKIKKKNKCLILWP